MEPKISKHWQSTKDPEGPTATATPGTFQDIDLSHCQIAEVDRIDAFCIENEITRSRFMHHAITVALNNKDRLLDPNFLSSRKLSPDAGDASIGLGLNAP